MDGYFNSTFVLSEHLSESRTFLDFRELAENNPKPGLRRVKSAGDLPSPIHTLPKAEIIEIGMPPTGPPPVLLGCHAVGTAANTKKAQGKRRNRRAKAVQVSQFLDSEALASTLKETGSSQQILEFARQNLPLFDFNLCIRAIHASAKQASNPALCRSSDIFYKLVERMHSLLLAMSHPSSDIAHLLTDALYSFAKLDAIGFHHVIYDISRIMPSILHQCSTVELSTALWSLGRLAPAEAPSTNMTQQAHTLAAQIMGHIVHRPLDQLTPHCMSEVLYAKARLELRGKQVQNLMEACKNAICQRASLNDFSAQGLANMAWSLAKTHVRTAKGGIATAGKTTGEASLKIMKEARQRLGCFEMLELSMFAWAVAKLHGKTEGALAPDSCDDFSSFISAIADESVRRFELMSAQSISNVAWALTKLDRMKDESSCAFFTKAMTSMIARPHEFSPQAISNLCYAVSWLNSKSKNRTQKLFRDTMMSFAEVAARESLAREGEFKWQDLAGVLVAISPRFRHDNSPIGRGPYTKRLAERLGCRVAREGHGLTTQVGLNIAVAACRIGLQPEVLQQVTCTISSVINSRTPRVNGHDLRQFKELQNCTNGQGEQFQ